MFRTLKSIIKLPLHIISKMDKPQPKNLYRSTSQTQTFVSDCFSNKTVFDNFSEFILGFVPDRLIKYYANITILGNVLDLSNQTGVNTVGQTNSTSARVKYKQYNFTRLTNIGRNKSQSQTLSSQNIAQHGNDHPSGLLSYVKK